MQSLQVAEQNFALILGRWWHIRDEFFADFLQSVDWELVGQFLQKEVSLSQIDFLVISGALDSSQMFTDSIANIIDKLKWKLSNNFSNIVKIETILQISQHLNIGIFGQHFGHTWVILD